MAREFVPFNEAVIDDEREALRKSSSVDLAKLDACMVRIEDTSPHENPSPAMIESFAEGFKELRHVKGDYKGRLLFYEPSIPKGTEDLVMLVVFRKQTQKTPRTVVRTAVERMNGDMRKRKEGESQ